MTAGAYTDLVDIRDAGYEDWTVLAEAGSLSPHSRTSVTWAQSRAPIKPEIVLEGGNRAMSPARREVLTLDLLSLLSTGKDVDTTPLVSFQDTSAATAQAARIAARLAAAHPEYWPETVRALIVHSASGPVRCSPTLPPAQEGGKNTKSYVGTVMAFLTLIGLWLRRRTISMISVRRYLNNAIDT